MPLNELDSGQNSRTRLIESAIFCFSEKGFDATGIREIAQRAKANSALVQYHFGGKEGLFGAALKYIFEREPVSVPHQPPVDADAPDAREQALLALRDLIGQLLRDLLSCNSGTPLDQAAMLLVTREMQAPHSKAIPLILNHVQPYLDHIDGCLRVLRPGLDRKARLDMHVCILGPIFHLHCNLPLARIFRDDPEFPRNPEDIEPMVEHFTEFCIRGIGSPEAHPNQGA